MRLSYKKLGDYIEQYDKRNKDYSNPLEINFIKGISSIYKSFIKTRANLVGVSPKNYKVVESNCFAFNPNTARMGDKIPIALNLSDTPILVSSIYPTFKIVDHSILLPEYVMMWFKRPEFDRYARYKSHGSAREVFDFGEMQDVELPIPSIEKQREIVAEYNTIVNRIKLNETLNQKLEDTAQALYKHWFVDFNFPITKESCPELVSGAPELEGKPYKSSGGEMIYNAELDMEIPEGWEVEKLIDLSDLITKGTTPQKMYSNFVEGKIPYIKAQSIGLNHFINPLKTDFIDIEDHTKELKRSIIVEDDILFTITGTLGEFAIVDKEINEANTNQNVAIIRFKDRKIYPRFIMFLFIGNWHREFLLENTQEAVQANINLTMIGNMKIIMPSINFLKKLMKIVDVLIEQKYNLHKQNNKLLLLEQLVLSKMSKVETITAVV